MLDEPIERAGLFVETPSITRDSLRLLAAPLPSHDWKER
jgi:hypothetical protein